MPALFSLDYQQRSKENQVVWRISGPRHPDQINERLLEGSCIEKMDAGDFAFWDVSKVRKGDDFLLGRQGLLKVLEKPSSKGKGESKGEGVARSESGSLDIVHPLIVEWYGVKNDSIQEARDVDIQQTFYGRNPKEHHTEYMSPCLGIQPIPVFILSDSGKLGTF